MPKICQLYANTQTKTFDTIALKVRNYVLNFVYSVFYKPGRADETYIEMANDFFVADGGSCDIAKKLFKAINY